MLSHARRVRRQPLAQHVSPRHAATPVAREFVVGRQVAILPPSPCPRRAPPPTGGARGSCGLFGPPQGPLAGSVRVRQPRRAGCRRWAPRGTALRQPEVVYTTSSHARVPRLGAAPPVPQSCRLTRCVGVLCPVATQLTKLSTIFNRQCTIILWGQGWHPCPRTTNTAGAHPLIHAVSVRALSLSERAYAALPANLNLFLHPDPCPDPCQRDVSRVACTPKRVAR